MRLGFVLVVLVGGCASNNNQKSVDDLAVAEPDFAPAPDLAKSGGDLAEATGGDFATSQADLAGGDFATAAPDLASTDLATPQGDLAVAACAAPGNTLYVDANTGSDSTGNGSTACPFKSVTKALTRPGPGTTFTTVRVRAGLYSAGTTQEVFPLVLPPGVTLTGDAPPASSIMIGGSALVSGGFAPVPDDVNANIVYSGPGSAVISNLMLLGVNETTEIVACRGGSLTLSGVRMSGGQRGASILGSCSATLNGTTSDNNLHAGVEVATSAGAQLAGHVSDADEDGIHLHAGSLSADGLEVKNADSAGVVVRGEDRGVSDELVFTAGNLQVHHCAAGGLIVEHGDPDVSSVSVFIGSLHHNFYGIYLDEGQVSSATTLDMVSANDNKADGIVINVDHFTPGHLVIMNTVTLNGNCTVANSLTEACPGLRIDSGAVQASGLTVTNNKVEGVFADMHGNNSFFECDGCTISGNLYTGVWARAAEITNYLQIAGGTIANNGLGGPRNGANGHGVVFQDIGGVLSNLTISGNSAGAGVLIDNDNLSEAVEIVDCDIFGNGAMSGDFGGSLPFGGVVVRTSLDAFDIERTKVHDNLKHGLSFFKRTGAGRIAVSLGVSSCPEANAFYCYGSGNVGVAAYDFMDINAENSKWSQPSPSPTADFLGLDTGPVGDTGAVDATPECSPSPVPCL